MISLGTVNQIFCKWSLAEVMMVWELWGTKEEVFYASQERIRTLVCNKLVGMCADSSGGFYYARERWSPRVVRSNGKPAAKAAIMPPSQGLPTEHYRASESPLHQASPLSPFIPSLSPMRR